MKLVANENIWNKIKVQVHLKPTDRPHIRDFKIQTVDKDLFKDYKCISILPFVNTWPTIIASPEFIRDNPVLTLCEIPNELSQKIAELNGHVVMNLVYHLDSGDWLVHCQTDQTELDYEWINPNPPDPDERDQWIRTNMGIDPSIELVNSILPPLVDDEDEDYSI